MNHNDAIRLFAKTLQNLEQLDGQGHRTREGQVLRGRRARPGTPGAGSVRRSSARCSPPATRRSTRPRTSAASTAPSHPDTEQTFAELRQRIQKCLSFLETVQAKDLAGAEERKVAPPWLGGKWLRGDDYLVHVALPNFFFHATMAYAILRHNGVDLGKMDYIGSIPTKEG